MKTEEEESIVKKKSECLCVFVCRLSLLLLLGSDSLKCQHTEQEQVRNSRLFFFKIIYNKWFQLLLKLLMWSLTDRCLRLFFLKSTLNCFGIFWPWGQRVKSCVDFRQTVCVGGGAQREGGADVSRSPFDLRSQRNNMSAASVWTTI